MFQALSAACWQHLATFGCCYTLADSLPSPAPSPPGRPRRPALSAALSRQLRHPHPLSLWPGLRPRRLRGLCRRRQLSSRQRGRHGGGAGRLQRLQVGWQEGGTGCLGGQGAPESWVGIDGAPCCCAAGALVGCPSSPSALHLPVPLACLAFLAGTRCAAWQRQRQRQQSFWPPATVCPTPPQPRRAAAGVRQRCWQHSLPSTLRWQHWRRRAAAPPSRCWRPATGERGASGR